MYNFDILLGVDQVNRRNHFVAVISKRPWLKKVCRSQLKSSFGLFLLFLLKKVIYSGALTTKPSEDRVFQLFYVCFLFNNLELYRTSRPVEFSKSGLSRNQVFSFPNAELLTLINRRKKINQKPKINFFFSRFFWNRSQFSSFDTKFVSRDLIIWEMYCPGGPIWKIWMSGPVWSGNTYFQSSRAL